MKYLNIVLGLLLIATVVNAAQKSNLTIREVRDPVQLRSILNSNAADAESRLLAVSAFFADGILSQGGLAIDTDASEFKTESTIYYTVNGIQYSKVASTGLTFTAANTINVAQSTNSAFYGSWLIEMNAAGTVATKPAGGLTNQVYTTAAASLAALPAPTAANVAIGTVTIKADAGDAFVANTTDMTTNSTTFVDAAIKVIP
jgi:hypothetical protein